MTTAAICATREVSWSPSFYRGEQFDSDLGLYYLRARYYNPMTGRFPSRDPSVGKRRVPATLHKYLYVGGDPVNWIDPRGREMEEYELRLQAAQAGTRFIATIACGATLGFYAAEMVLDSVETLKSAKENPLGPSAAAIGCIYMLFPETFMEGVPEIAVNIVGTVGCSSGIVETVQALNKVDHDTDTAARDEDMDTFGTDMIHGIFDCGIAGLGSIWAVGGALE